MTMRLAHFAFWAEVLAQATAAQTSLALLEGPSPTNLRLSVLDEGAPTNPRRIVLAGLEMLPVEITNRTTQQSLMADRPRTLVEQGVSFVEFGGKGRILRYARQPAGRFGFVLIRPDGGAAVLLELAGSVDPFADRFGVAPDGRHAAVVTRAGALYAVRLDGGSYASTQTPARRIAVPGTVDEVSVCVGPTHVFFQTEDDRIWRCALADGAAPQDMTPTVGGNDVRLKEEMAPSGDGSAVVFLYGPQDFYSLYLLRSGGAAIRLPPPPAKYEEPGYLPETPAGPRLLLNADASRLLYTDATNREEIYLLDTSGAAPTTHLTSDPNFVPYIGTGIYPVFVASVVAIAIGEPGGFDWFTAAAGSPGVLNVTATANEGPPWVTGTLAPRAARLSAVGDLLIEESTAGGGATHLRRLDPIAGTSAVVATQLRAALQLGRAPQAPDLLIPRLAGDLLVSPALSPVVAAPAGVELSPSARFPGGTGSVFVASVPGLSAALFLLPGGGLVGLPPDPGLRQAVVTPGGGLLLNGTQLLYARPGYSAVLGGSETPIRVVLSHAQ